MGFETEASRQNKRRVEIYVPAEKKPVIEKAKQLFKREGSSLSEFVIKKVEEHVDLHSEGNPQQLMPRYLAGLGPFIAQGPCGFRFCNVPAVATGIYLATEKEYRLCDRHQSYARKRPDKWKVTNKKVGK